MGKHEERAAGQGTERGKSGMQAAETLEDLLAFYLGQTNDGDRVEPDQVRRAHPALADEILKGLEVFAEMQSSNDANVPPLGTLGDS